tara:strand:- start:1731 stop:2693 length:963 start_codon:yes stop_codon:yes gene_type:complete
VLFDPVFEDCCAPINFKSLRRYTPPPCEIEDLPTVDVVVISHSHYDHLSYPTVLRIKEKFPSAHFFAPLGNKQWFEKCGVRNVTELDWWETRDVKLAAAPGEKDRSVSVTPSSSTEDRNDDIVATIGALPCQHVSARSPFDKNKTLWASWSVESGGSKVYFAGYVSPFPFPKHAPSHFFSNTNPHPKRHRLPLRPAPPPDTDDYGPAFAHLPVCPAFAQIGAHRGPFDLGLIPIGAYEPRYMFSGMHADPRDSANIFVDTRCRRALGMHWGTWVLTEEDVLEPPRKLAEALRWKGLGEEVFRVCDLGESREFESGDGVEE